MPKTILAVGILVAAPIALLAQEGPGIDPVAIEIATTSSEYLADQGSMSMGWFVTYDEILDGREKRTNVWSGESLLVRGEGYRASSTEGTEIREYYYDGAVFTALFGDQGQFAQIETSGDFGSLVETLIDSYDFTLPLSDVFDQSGAAEGLAQASDAVYVGEVLFGGVAAHHLAFRRYEADWELFISADPAQPVPLMMTGSNPYVQGWPKFQAIFYDWNFSPDITSDSFSFAEPEGFERIELPSVEGAEQ